MNDDGYQIRRLPFLDHSKKPVGIISIAGLTDDDRDGALAGQILGEISKRGTVGLT